MSTEATQRVVIVGGGTAGWIAATALARQLGDVLNITLIESDQIGTIGVGEASIPPMRVFHKLLRIDERDFMRATAATFKLGIRFDNWGQVGDQYTHSFGKTGKETWLGQFHHFWLRAKELGIDYSFSDYCYEAQAMNAGRFATSERSNINYAYHLDSTRYAGFLRAISENEGVHRIEGKVETVQQNTNTGFIESLRLKSGRTVAGDLFIDCTGFRGLLIEQTLKTGYEDWSHWLMCDRAIALQTTGNDTLPPYTLSSAHDAGWRWCIPLQHRTGNGLVYASRHLSDDEARAQLMYAISGDPITEPRLIQFQTGRRRQAWNKNCIALGLSSGFIEPLESTSIHLIMTGITRLMKLFPYKGTSTALMEEYNRQTKAEVEHIRDFIILHYHATNREDSSFWRHCRSMHIPDSLQQRIDLFRSHAHAYQDDSELFRVDSWAQVLLGQGIYPASYHPVANVMGKDQLCEFMNDYRDSVTLAVDNLPSHKAFIRQYCPMTDKS